MKKRNSYLRINDKTTGQDYTPDTFRALQFRRGEKDNQIILSWAVEMSDRVPKKGATIQLWIDYESTHPDSQPACLFVGEVTSYENDIGRINAIGYLP